MNRNIIWILLAAAALLLLAGCMGSSTPVVESGEIKPLPSIRETADPSPAVTAAVPSSEDPTAAPPETEQTPESITTEEPTMTETVTETKPVRVFGCDTVFFGDSITCDSDFNLFYPDLRIVNLGVYGDTLEEMLARVPQVKAADPARIFVMGGVNCLRVYNVDKTLEQYDALLDALEAACPDAEITVESVLPIAHDLLDPAILTNETIRGFNQQLEQLAAAHGWGFVDLWPAYEKDGELNPALTRDGLHLNFTDYGPWAEAIAPYMEP